jgi:RNA polymerase sigma factor (TIGR02999 family)
MCPSYPHSGRFCMSDVTRILSAIEQGDPQAAEQLLPLVYDELRKLAAARLAQEKPGQTLQATALVHEAYLRLVGGGQKWDGRAHFFAAAAEAMRRTLVESARRKGRAKRGGGLAAHSLEQVAIPANEKPDQVLAIDEALTRLEANNGEAARLVKLRYFAGFSLREAAEILGVSPRKADQVWAYARAWLLAELGDDFTA